MKKFIFAVLALVVIIAILALIPAKSQISAFNAGFETPEELVMNVKEFLLGYKPSMDNSLRKAFSEQTKEGEIVLSSYHSWSELLKNIDNDVIANSVVRFEGIEVLDRTVYCDLDGNEITREEWDELCDKVSKDVIKETGIEGPARKFADDTNENKPISISESNKFFKELDRISDIMVERKPKSKDLFKVQPLLNFYKFDSSMQNPYLSLKIELSDGKYYLSREGIPIFENNK
jgi:hypothetical protein